MGKFFCVTGRLCSRYILKEGGKMLTFLGLSKKKKKKKKKGWGVTARKTSIICSSYFGLFGVP